MCVTRRRIVQHMCDNEQVAFDMCKNAPQRCFCARGIGPALSESGVFKFVVQRNMDADTLFCRDFDMEIRLLARRNGTLIENTLTVLNSNVDAATQRLEMDVAFIQFDSVLYGLTKESLRNREEWVSSFVFWAARRKSCVGP